LTVESAQRTGEQATYEAALALYSGDLLPHELYAEWVDARREVVRSQFTQVLQALAALYERDGQLEAAIRTLQRLVYLDQTDEDSAFNIIRLYGMIGQRHQALRHFNLLQRALQRDLDCDPEPHTLQLRDRIMRSMPVAALRDRDDLTGRERQISTLLASGLTNRCIATTLGMSTRTAETHVSRILRKLDVRSRNQVAVALGHS
jgi:DNA-binding SARP family transcriptional activator